MGLARQLRAVLALPFMVTIVTPSLLLFGFRGVDSRWFTGPAPYALVFFIAVGLLLSGSFLFAVTVYLFQVEGKGSLAPWDPTQKLVVRGPYTFVRNPMIMGVLGILAGESLLLGSFVLGLWAATFFAVNHLYSIRSEEPGLLKRFGSDYEVYAKSVARWLPNPSSLLALRKDSARVTTD